MSTSATSADPAGSKEWRGRRADARRNHDEVFAAAVQVFAERGEDATIPEVAERAGVGKATVYRSYPTKAELIDAVAAQQLDWLDERVRIASLERDAFVALVDLLGDISERLARDRLFGQVLVRAGQWRRERDHEGTLATILDRARESGHVREDVKVQDVQVLVGGFSRMLLELDIRDPQEWRRYSTLVLNALRSGE